MKIEIGKKTQTIIVFLLLIGVASAISEYGNNINIPGNIDAIFGNFTNVRGNGSGLSALNASNLTGVPPNASIPLSAANLSAANNTFTGNVSAKKIGGVIYADQYATLQAAIDASDVNSDGYADQPVYIPSGEYNFSKWGQIVLINNSVIYGAGQNNTIIRMPANAVIVQPNLEGNEDLNYAMITNKRPAGHLGERNISIKDMTLIWGNETVPSWGSLMYYGNGISIFGAVDLEISRVTVINPPSFGIWVKGYFVNSTNTLPTNAKVHHNTIINAGRDQDTLVGGIMLTNVVSYSSITENYVYNSTSGIVLEDRSSNNIVSDNNIYNCRASINASGIREVTAWGKDSFTANIIENCYVGISVHGTISSTFSENIINKTTDDGIRITSGSDSIYHDNIISYTKTAINESVANSRNLFYDNNLYLSNTNKINQTGNPKASWAWQNYGTSPFNWGNLNTPPTEYGAPWGFGDKYSNSTSLDFTCGYTGTQWQNATGNTDVC